MIYRIIKRIFDFVCALLGIIVTSPLWIIGIIGILISDWGPIFYTAHRIGKNNKLFKMYKFRSMRVLKEPKKGAEASLRPEEDRIFPCGHFIRRIKIDELPQLLNILNGTMSLVGPRPVAKDQFDMFRYGKWDEAKSVPVGLSGPAALYDFVYGDNFTDEKEYMEKVYPTRRELEYTYVKKAGFFYDLKMIIYTVICIVYTFLGKEATWILREFLADAKASNSEIEVMPKL
ncbi:lipopolysaccharide/colanic/teichoic acid biosynthesis glycosyltransferase [Bacteroides heparinolyticus]|uniref:Lipopolysaccharide/colanic/teichoic acid biosynthesis glycosyltransferase n=1 Tax=Prevotella heparinolytica TaxID=28113 RepID=A0A4R2LFV6_9BACE|nr:sugar transferase [Bacteroides heparinolyticus]TCO88911.1 lipopolysaccharide/colanic/teichoic acid biosynthesis glycosyltransferase [Bacteroides heparinolyticus]